MPPPETRDEGAPLPLAGEGERFEFALLPAALTEPAAPV